MLRTDGEQLAYLDGFEMCGECIEQYLSPEGKQKLSVLIKSVKNAIAVKYVSKDAIEESEE